MKTIILFFSDHAPIRFEGDLFNCSVQVANARLYKGFVSWEMVG